MRFRAILIAALVAAVAFTGIPASASVHAGDELTVIVFDHPELSGPVSVDSADHISVPLAGSIDVRGLSTQQIAARVTSSLSRYVIKPGVSVQLRTQLPVVFVSGGPGGTLKYNPGETLVAALGDISQRFETPRDINAGANTGAAAQAVPISDLRRSPLDLHHVGLLRDARALGTYDAIALSAQGSGGPELQAGDTITISNKPIGVPVSGEVARPGVAYLDANEPLSDALLQTGGLLPSASTSRIQVYGNKTNELLAQGDARWNQPATTGMAIDALVAPRVNIAGSVDKPGPVLLKTDPTLVTALYEAGGPTKWADLRYVQVTKNGLPVKYDITRLIHGDLTQNPTLHDGDMVFVPEGHKIAFGQLFQTILSTPLIYGARL